MDAEQLEEKVFGIIAFSGDAKSSYIEAIALAKKGEYDKALEKIENAKESYTLAHKNHLELMQSELQGEKILSMLLVHAEDQMMSCEVFELFSKEFIELYKKINS